LGTLLFKSLGILALAPLVVTLSTSVSLTRQPSAEALQQVRTQSLTSPNEIIKRAQSWVAAKVPYDERQLHDGYREDCSGLVSSAWGLTTPGYTTKTLPSVAYPITKDQLAPGDILNNRDGDGNQLDAHVLIFAGWANASHSQYNAYEENPYWNGAHYTTNIPYPFWPGYSQSYVPMRYKNLGGTVPSPAPTTQDWKTRQYSLTCDNIVRAPVSIAFHDGQATVAGTDIGSYDHWNLHIEQIANGVLPSLGAVTAVLFYCTPQPSNFFNQELHVYRTGDGSEIGRIPDLQSPGSGSTGILPGVFNAGSIAIKNSQVTVSAMFYGPGDSHASGPSILRHLAWIWNGQEFITTAATQGPTPPCTSAALSNALRAANVPLVLPQNWVVHDHACQSGYALAELGGSGYPVDAIFKQQGASWMFVYVLGEFNSFLTEQNGSIIRGCKGGPSQALLQSLIHQAGPSSP
jgi:hypothetical protein